MPNVPANTLYVKTITNTASNASLATAALGLDAAVDTAYTNLYAALPAGFQAGTVTLGPVIMSYDTDNSVYALVQQMFCNIVHP